MIDLLIISDSFTYGEAYGAVERVARTLGRQVNPTVYTAAEFSKRAPGRERIRDAVARAAERRNQCTFKHSSRNRPVNDSMAALSVGLPRRLKSRITPLEYAHRSIAALTNAVPLSP
jgi:hypothetical protein